MAALSTIPPPLSSHSLGPPDANSSLAGARLKSSSTALYAAGRPLSPDPSTLTVRQPPHAMHHPQPQLAAPVSGTGSLAGSVTPTPSLSQQPTMPHSPRTIEHAMRAEIASTPPPRPARAAMRSPSSLSHRSPSAPPLSDSPTVRLIQKAHENSKDGGETLDLSREKIDRISDEDVEFFRTRVGKHNQGVWRLALSYNNLYDGSIAASFCTLNRLRYLNLKGNHLTVIPPALCEMNGLEILDLSKNQIAALPDQPGRLATLKVLSLSNNALTTLPTYLVTFTNLKVFKVDHNPIEWPPPEILGPLVDAEPPGARRAAAAAIAETGEQRKGREEDLRPWVEGMKIWLQEQITDGNIPPRRSVEAEGYIVTDEQTSPTTTTSYAAWAAPGPSQQTVKRIIPPPATNGSSTTEATPVSPTKSSFRQRNRAATVSEDSLIHVNTSTLSLPSQGIRHDRSISSSSSLTPPISASTSSSHSGPPSAGLPRQAPPVPSNPHPQVSGHSRGGSYTVPHRLSGNLATKKSLPDLRKSHAKIIEERRNEGVAQDGAIRMRSPIDLGVGYRNQANRKVSPPSAAGADKVRTLKTMASMDVLRRPKEHGAAVTDLERRQANPDTPSLDESRNSYFRRVSMLPPSTISKAVSPAMLMFVDAVRGILFALTQLHSALRQYVNFAVSDRVAGVFARVLEPAGGYLSNLINALDRFDSTSRRTAPPVTAVRGVIDAAKESIAVFGKIVAVLRFQTPAFKDADVRYTRQLLLSIYGGMAEIAQSWKTMAPLLVEIKPILHPDGPRVGMVGLAPPMSKSNSMSGGRTPISPIPESGETQSPERAVRPLAPPSSAGSLGAPSAPGLPPIFSSPRGKSRRHAGSFSTEDVERGMLMGSPVNPPRTDWPDLSRTIFEDNEAMADTAPPPFPLHAEPEPPHMTPPQAAHRDVLPPIVTSFSQPGRSRHAAMSSTGSSFLYAPTGGARSLSVDVRPPTPASATLFDEDLLDQIETATEIAFTVWLRLSEDVGVGGGYGHVKSDSISSAGGCDRKQLPLKQLHELAANLSRAEQVTMTLRESLMGLRANPFAYAHASLPENAQAFIKQVVKVLELVKMLTGAHTFSVQVRQALSQLTQATRECAILIQVSSLQPLQPPMDRASSSSVNLNSAVDYKPGAHSLAHGHGHVHALSHGHERGDRHGHGLGHATHAAAQSIDSNSHGNLLSHSHTNSAASSQLIYRQASSSVTDFSRPNPDFRPDYKPDFSSPPQQQQPQQPQQGQQRDFNCDYGHPRQQQQGHGQGLARDEYNAQAMSSAEDLGTSGLRGLHLPRARELRERIGAR